LHGFAPEVPVDPAVGLAHGRVAAEPGGCPLSRRRKEVTVINRRNLLVSSSLGCPIWSLVRAQQAPRTIGFLSPYTRLKGEPWHDVFFQAMRDLGYVRGQDYVVVQRFAEGKNERLPELANELVRLKVDVIEASATNAAAAAQRATAVIPIVFDGVSNPVLAGFADSLAHPGHNMTGLTNLSGELNPKRLELLKKMVPGLTRVAVLANPTNPNSPWQGTRIRPFAKELGLSLTLVNASTRDELELAFRTMLEQRAQAVSVAGDAFLWDQGELIAELALASRLPSMFAFAEEVAAGGLMSYGVDTPTSWRQLATYVDKIFKGARPGDLPIQRPMKVDLVINRKTADALGLTIPYELRMRATRVIE
jgi:putative ABC transport system substrate-binding protein